VGSNPIVHPTFLLPFIFILRSHLRG